MPETILVTVLVTLSETVKEAMILTQKISRRKTETVGVTIAGRKTVIETDNGSDGNMTC